jgi:hypothetical protein
MKLKFFLTTLALLLILSPLGFAQSRETGAIVGTISDEEGSPLPGVTVTLTSPNIMGDRTVVTSVDGGYRFPALPPGLYSLRAELEGFATKVQENIRLSTTVRLTIDITLQLTSMQEEVTVIAESPTVDVKTSETASVTLSNDILRNIPTNQFVADIVNLAPGVTQDAAYGASESTGISYQIDGVDVSDPSGGSAWVFLDYNILEEVKVMGVGLPAEYGAFTGVIFNTVTKSGGNQFSGQAQAIFQDTKKGFWTAENNADYIDDFPDLESPVNGLLDLSANLGGPIIRDRLWFFAGAQYLREKERPAGFQAPNFRDYKQPRYFLKFTSQLSSNFHLTVFVENDSFNGINRRASATHPTPETCVDQTSPDWVGNFDLTWIINSKTFLDLKGSFFDGYYYLDPQGEGTAVFSAEDYQWYNNSNWWYKADRDRYQANAALSHYAEDFIAGNHDFKFGAEFETGSARDRFGYTGYVEGIGNAVYIYDWFGYLYAYQYEGYDVDQGYTRTEVFAQDSWSISDRLTVNFGVRWSMMKGTLVGVSGNVYDTNRFSPRIGLAWDIFGDRTTVLKAHYGQFTENMYAGLHWDLAPADQFSDYIGYWYDGEEWVEDWRDVHGQVQAIPDPKHPYMQQFTVGIERELFRDASFGVTFISRSWHNFLGQYNDIAEYELETISDDYDTGTWQVYNRLNVGENENYFGNIKKGDPWVLDDLNRTYNGVQFTFNKRMSNRWQLLASYVYSQTKGTMDNGFGDDIGWANTTSPNAWINRDGPTTVDPTHMLKLQGSYILPFDIWFNAYFSYISGNTWTKRIRTSLDQGRTTFFAEPRGSQRYDARVNLDLRLEKTFLIMQKYRIGIMMDIFNVFNSNTITSWGTRWGYDWQPLQYEPDAAGPDGHEVYGLVSPRAIRLGARFFF